MPDAEFPDVLSVVQVAAYLHVSRETVISALNAGKMPGVKIGRAWRIRRLDLDRMLSGEWKAGEHESDHAGA